MEPYYQEPGITIYNCDCRDILSQLSFALLLIDPPYGISHRSNGQIFKQSSRIAGDETTGVAMDVLEMCNEVPTACFFSPYAWLPVKWRSVLVWNKGEHVGIGGDRATCWKRDFELIGVRNNPPLNGQRDSAVINVRALSPPPTGHVAEKPVELIQILLSKIPAGSVCDAFMGSGTTLVAAKSAIGCELDTSWCETAVNRLRQSVIEWPEETVSETQAEMFE